MALFNHLALLETENVHKILPSKQFGVNDSQSVKKKALQDVGNTLHEKSVERASKPFGSTTKHLTKGKTLFSEVKTTKKSPIKQEDGNHTLTLRNVMEGISDLEEGNIEPVCKCDMSEDEYEDFMFKNISLTKKQIDDLALIWENPPTLGINDIRKVDLETLQIPEPEFLGFSWDSVLDHSPENSFEITEVPLVFCEMSEHDDSFDCCSL